ncbi:hypothetical protein BGX21_000612 [Mortierella sp. AD011]|nr:hypothetical protein BGX20_000547 [Mortierella sp. AD010]KAF9387305.1 hypothetical protein BGX21_000612 [Mortierella sp. AD011]
MSEKNEYPAEKVDLTSENEEEEIEETQQFTWRAAIIGSLLGLVVAASNLYLGLSAGWTFGAALWGSILGFLILKSVSKVTGNFFGPKENCVVQTAATTAGGLSSGYVTAIPAMYRLGLMSSLDPRDHVSQLLLWTTCSAFFGMFFAIPLRSHFIINQDLPFPSCRAAAETIKSLHKTGSSAARDARQSGIYIGLSFLISTVWGVIAYFIPGIFEAIHILYYIGKAAGSTAVANADAVWSWYFKWDFSFFGAGLMTPGNTIFSLLAGQLIAFGITGPLLVSSGYLKGPLGFPPPPAIGSAQSWFLWPGIGLMVCSSFAELGAQGPTLYRGIKDGIFEIRNLIRKFQKKEELNSGVVTNDPTPKDELIPTYYWVSGILIAGIMTICVMSLQFHIPAYATIGCLFFSFILAFVALQSSGETDITPSGALGKVTQLVFARVPGPDIKAVQKSNLMCGVIVTSVCSQSVDMVGDLKTAYLLRASPRAMFWAQMVGSVFAIAIAFPLFLLYSTAYPCILDSTLTSCKFSLPSVTAWANFCKLVTGDGKIPPTAMTTMIIVCVLAVLNVVIKTKFIPKSWKPYWPNLNAVGIGFIVPNPYYGIAFVIGWTAGFIWRKMNQKHYEKLIYSVGAGCVAGAGIAGIFTAAFTIAGVKGRAVTAGCGYDLELC